MPAVNINGVQLNYQELGDRNNRTIVFAHTILFGSEVFDPLVSELVRDFHLVKVDQHGHGQSGYRTPLTVEDMTADYYQLLTRLKLSNVIWVGYSIGGMIGMRLALTHPKTIGSLILIATTAAPEPPHLREATGKLWELFRDGHREDIADPALQYFFSPATCKNQPALVEWYRNRMISFRNVEGMFEAAGAAMNRTDIRSRIDAITVPTLVIAGKDDIGGAAPAESELIASRIPNAKLAIIEDASHLLVVEKPREVIRLVREFLK